MHYRKTGTPARTPAENKTASATWLLAAAIGFARHSGGAALEAYPVGKPGRSHDDFMFFGSRSLYERAGFAEVARRTPCGR